MRVSTKRESSDRSPLNAGPRIPPLDVGLVGTLCVLRPDGRFQSALEIEGGSKGQSTAITIMVGEPRFGGDDIAQQPAAFQVEIVGRLTWGAGGVRMICRELDIVRGARFTVAAEDVRLELRTQEVLNEEPPRLTIPVLAGYNPTAIAIPAQRTLRVGTIATGASSAAQRVPTFAARLRVYRTPAVPITIFFQDLTPTTIAQVSVALGDDAPELVLPHDVFHAVIRNDSATTGITQCRLVWELVL